MADGPWSNYGERNTSTRYAEQLETFLIKYKAAPPDIKFWPYGPYWPPHYYGPLLPTPHHIRSVSSKAEPLLSAEKSEKYPTTETNPANAKYPGRWRGVQIVYDAEKSCRDYIPRAVPEGLAPSLAFESRFECGNLRQARRIGAFEYELVLKTDLYTSRHTQWFYFRVLNAVPGVTYKFKIINFHKRDSLYNHGMRPLLYSDKRATMKNVGWERVGHHIVYARNTCNLQCPLLARDRSYYTLEWQMEFSSNEDTHYLAHCYPYTFTDLRDDLDTLLNDPERSKVMKRQVMCETRAGNSCFLITVTNFDSNEHRHKKAIVVTARVHPGETNSSWMMKGVLQYITGSSQAAKLLRDKFIFKIIPMLNPDGVIVGNYRCSLAGRDLNRNYRHPRKESFPTVWYTKAMMEEISHWNDILVYCDLHGHSRKHNVFMYGCNMDCNIPLNHQGAAQVDPENYIQERLFPWLMSQKAPDKFWFRGCKFQVKRCKESTGRVVMFKQMKISNSFTMEATFCGTTICRGEKRHFNTLDYQEMGRVFCEVVLDYQDVHENKARQSEVVLELTRAITQQILESRGLLSSDLPDFTTELGRHQLKTFPKDEVSSSEQIAAAFISMVTRDGSSANQSLKEAPPNNTKENPPDLSQMDIHQLLDTMSSQTIDGCAQLLEQLHVADTVGESDSSDSDSESEPEMKYSDPKARRRKKKQKKKARGSASDPGLPGAEDRSKVEHGTADLSGQGHDTTDRSHTADVSNGLPAIDAESQKRGKQGSGQGKYSKMMVKSYPTYVNKYSGRSNGGIPCFSQERLMARASKRVHEMKKRVEDDHPRRESIISVDEDIPSLHAVESVPPLQRLRTHVELRRQFQQVVPGGSHQARMGYMHAAAQGAEGGGVEPATTGLAADDDSSSEGSLEMDELPHRLPLAAMRTPYQTLLTTSSPGQPVLYPLQRRLGRLPWLPTLPHKPHVVVDSCSIPLRHAIPAANSSSGKGERAESVPSHGPLVIDTVGATQPMNRNVPLRKMSHRTDVQSIDSLSGPQGPLGLMSREYTDLLLTRLRNNKGSSFTASRFGERHSTCE